MPLIVTGYGRIEGPIEHKTIGEKNLHLATFRLNDGQSTHPVEAWGDTADQVPAAGTLVMVTGRVRSRAVTAKSGTEFIDTKVTATAIDLIETGASRQTTAPNPDPLFAD